MKLRDLLYELSIDISPYKKIHDLDVFGITDNSKVVNHQYIFVAIKGYQADGHDYIPSAIKNGATLVIGEKEIDFLDVPYIRVQDSRKALGLLSKKFYDNPSKDKVMIGITGTNGKTTTSYLIKHILEQCGKKCAIIGTIQNTINGKTLPSLNTTPSVLTLNSLLSESEDDVAIVEVSSHGLTQGRIEGIEFDIGIFTNLYHEHLDYHNTMEEYFQAKLQLFDHLKEDGFAIINRDNEWGEKLAIILKERKIRTYSIGEDPSNDVQLIDFSVKHSIIHAKENNDSIQMTSPIPGIHNMYNTMMAYLTIRKMDIPCHSIQQAVMSFSGVKGRFETYKANNMPTIIVDYAHTPDAIFHCVASAKTYGAKRIIHVFGFRGNRDKTKRPEMMSITSRYSDEYILTFDDLNDISTDKMIQELQNLNQKFGNHKGRIIPDRTLAIQQAIKLANEEDWIIITGKGHENYQQKFSVDTKSDKETVLLFIEQLKEQKIIH